MQWCDRITQRNNFYLGLPHVYTYIYTYNMHTYIHIYIHTYIHTYYIYNILHIQHTYNMRTWKHTCTDDTCDLRKVMWTSILLVYIIDHSINSCVKKHFKPSSHGGLQTSDAVSTVYAVLSARLNLQAFFEGKLKVAGNTALALRLQNVIPRPGKAKL